MARVPPDALLENIAECLRRRSQRVEGMAWECAHEDEDVTTGHYFGGLTGSCTIEVDGYKYTCHVRYRKFRGRGKGATEKRIGADGIVEIEVHDEHEEIYRKAALFQAKKEWRHKDSNLLKQVRRMERHCPGATFVINYAYDGFTATPGAQVLKSEGVPPEDRLPIGDYLAEFVKCRYGRTDVYYDAHRRLLVRGSRLCRADITHRLRISVYRWRGWEVPDERWHEGECDEEAR